MEGLALIFLMLLAVNFYGIVYLGTMALRYAPTGAAIAETSSGTVGGNWRLAHDEPTAQRFVLESEFLLPENLYIHNLALLPRFAWAALEANSMSREVLLSLDFNGRKAPDTEQIRKWHHQLKELFLDARWALPGPGGGIVTNTEGRVALETIALEGEDGLIRLLRRVVEERLRPPTRMMGESFREGVSPNVEEDL